MSLRKLLTPKDRLDVHGIDVVQQAERYAQWAKDRGLKQFHVFECSDSGKRAQDDARYAVNGILLPTGAKAFTVSTAEYDPKHYRAEVQRG